MFFAKILISRLPFRGHSGGGTLRRSSPQSLTPGLIYVNRDMVETDQSGLLLRYI